MQVEHGLARVVIDGGAEAENRTFTFRPSFGRVASLGSPHEIVALYASLHGPRAAQDAAYVLACLCDQEDATDLIGWADEAGPHPGRMPAAQQVILARHLMRHAIIGKAAPGKRGAGRFAEAFDASEYISAARVHLGLSSEEADALSMTEFQQMFEMKFPQAKGPDLATREEYHAARAAYAKFGGRRNG